MRTCVWAVILLLAAPGLLVFAQSVPAAAIQGVVIDAVTGEPVSGVLVTRRLPGDRPKTVATANGPRLMKSGAIVPAGLDLQTQTGADGRFSIEGLDSGRIEIAFGKNGYIVRTLEYTSFRADDTLLQADENGQIVEVGQHADFNLELTASPY